MTMLEQNAMVTQLTPKMADISQPPVKALTTLSGRMRSLGKNAVNEFS